MLVCSIVVSLEAFVTQIGYDLRKVQNVQHEEEDDDDLNRDTGHIDPEQFDTLVTEAQPLVNA